MIYFVLLVITLIGYLIGSLNSSLIVGKFYGVDVRQHGSGNAGATNTLRTLGKKAALFTFAGDFIKGILACVAGLYIFKFIFPDYDNHNIGLMFSGLGCILGHNWPVYFKFKGGKGVLTSFAVMIMMGAYPTLIAFGFFILMAVITRYISLSSMSAAIVLPVIGGLFGKSLGITDVKSFVIFTVIIAILVIYRHHSNIKRLINGTESKFTIKKNRRDV